MQPAVSSKLRLLGVLLLAFSLLLALALPAGAGAAKPKPIKGKLSERGYTVIALAKDGQAKTKRAPNGKFKLRPPAKKVTLHLRAADGTYGGPIVLAKRKKGKRAILGLQAKKKANLRKVKVNEKKGYAKLSKRAQKKLKKRKQLDKKREAKAKKGVPIGAGKVGLVRVKKLKDEAPGDLDRDGVANPLDVDDDGDLVLDNVDRKPRKGTKAGSATEAQGAQAGGPFHMDAWTSLPPSAGALNANAPGVDDADIEAALQANMSLAITPGFPPPDGSTYTSGELDCGELIYCSAGGTGKHEAFQFDPNPEPFPGEPGGPFDPDGDGLGSFDLPPPPPSVEGQLGLSLRPNATSDQIHGDDVLIARTNTDAGSQFEFTTTLEEVFATQPAIASYTDELGVTREVSYPHPDVGGALPVVDGPDADSDVEVTLNFWRPQRAPIPGDGTTDWIDIGGLQYYVGDANPPGGKCPASSFAESDPNLTVGTFTGFETPFTELQDSAPDRPASPANTFTYTLNLSDCLAPQGNSFVSGVPRAFNFGAHPFTTNDPVPLNDSYFFFVVP